MTDEEILDAYLDGEMEEAERARFEARLSAEPALRAALASRRGLDADLRTAYGGEPAAAFRLPPPKRRVPWILLPLAAAAGIGLGIALRPSSPPPAAPPSSPPVVAFLTQSTGAWRPATTVRAGDAVEVPADARATLVLSDGTEVRLDRGTRVRLAGGRRLEIAAGRLWSRVAPGDPFLLDAGETRVTVLGTELSVLRGPKSTGVQLFSGRAVVEAGGATRDLRPGQETEFADGRLSEPGHLGSEAIATGWMLELVAHAGSRDRELAEHLDRLLVDMGRTKAVMIEERALVDDLGKSCRVPLARYLVSEGAQSDLEPRRKAARVLARIADPTVAAELARALRDPDAEVRVSAAAALRRASAGKVCSMPEAFRGSCDDGEAAAAEAWAGTQVTPK